MVNECLKNQDADKGARFSPSFRKKCAYEHKKCIYSEASSKIQTNVLFLVVARGLWEVFSLLNYAEINSFSRTKAPLALINNTFVIVSEPGLVPGYRGMRLLAR